MSQHDFCEFSSHASHLFSRTSFKVKKVPCLLAQNSGWGIIEWTLHFFPTKVWCLGYCIYCLWQQTIPTIAWDVCLMWLWLNRPGNMKLSRIQTLRNSVQAGTDGMVELLCGVWWVGTKAGFPNILTYKPCQNIISYWPLKWILCRYGPLSLHFIKKENCYQIIKNHFKI